MNTVLWMGDTQLVISKATDAEIVRALREIVEQRNERTFTGTYNRNSEKDGD
jgi:hypothetical protein